MLIDPMSLQTVAVRGYGCIPIRMGNDDPTLVYEQVVLYEVCRYRSGLEWIDMDSEFENWKKAGHDSEWLELSASKTHPMIIEHPWEQVFPDYLPYLAKRKPEKFKQMMEQENKATASKN